MNAEYRNEYEDCRCPVCIGRDTRMQCMGTVWEYNANDGEIVYFRSVEELQPDGDYL